MQFYNVKDAIPEDLGRAFALESGTMPRARLKSGSWQFENDALAALRAKIIAGKKTLGEVYGAPLRGIVTGLNDAFIIDRPTRDRLMMDPKSGDLLMPFLKGENIKRWRIESDDLYLINTPRAKVDIEAYPLVKAHLLLFRADLEKRATKQEWWELQQAQLAYQDSFLKPKIIYQDIANSNPFVMDSSGIFPANTCYFIPSCDFNLIAFLNSRLGWFALSAMTNIARGGYLRLRTNFVTGLSIPNFDVGEESSLMKQAEKAGQFGTERYKTLSSVSRRILDLSPPNKRKLTEKLQAWHTLSFPDFLAAVKSAYGIEIPLKNRGEWQDYLAEEGEKVLNLTAQILKTEAEIDTIIYQLFDLNPDEIALIEATVPR